jgi:hypothetical protein
MQGNAPFQTYQKGDGFWYWFDEIKAESLPYKTKESAEGAIERYRDCFLSHRTARSRNNPGKNLHQN